MSVTIDANVLLYASDEASPHRRRALDLLDELAEGPALLYLFWPVVMAYLRISTHPNVFSTQLLPEEAIANVDDLLAFAHVQTAGESERFWGRYRDVAFEANVRANLVSDAHLVALMRENGVRSIWTHDRDYRRFAGIEILDPFGEPTAG